MCNEINDPGFLPLIISSYIQLPRLEQEPHHITSSPTSKNPAAHGKALHTQFLIGIFLPSSVIVFLLSNSSACGRVILTAHVTQLLTFFK